MMETRKRRRLSDSTNLESEPQTPQDGQKSESPKGEAHSSSKKAHRRTLFVRSLPPSATTESLTEYFSQSYPIKHATAVADPQTKQCKGYGFVTFADVEDAQRALGELNGSVFDGRKLKIEVAEPRHREIDEKIGKSVPSAEATKLKEEREQRRKEAQPPKLIVRNLPWSVGEPEQLAVLFRSYGKVKHAVIPKKGSRHAGFGFVVMRGKKNAEKALEGVNGKEVDGRTLAVDWAVDKEVWDTLQQPTDNTAGKLEDGQTAVENGVDGHSGVENDSAKSDDAIEPGTDVDAEMEDVDFHGSGDEEGEEDEEQEDDDDEEEDGDDDRNASTVFIRNLPFSATDETLYEHFTRFGAVRYARIVVDPETDRPRGTGFVCFWKEDEAKACIRESPKRTEEVLSKDSKQKSAFAIKKSVLENEQADPSGKYTIDGRVLQVSQAVSRKEASRLEAEGSSRRDARDKDKRRLYLLSEGTIPTNSPLYSKLSPSEVKMREASAKQRQKLIKSNPMLHISLTRLSVRNIPRHVDSKVLKQLAREAVVGFAKDVKSGHRQPLSKEELSRSAELMKEQEKLRKIKGKGIVKQAKVIFEGREGSKISDTSGAGRSRGYGFIEYTSHRSALMGLRWLNGYAVGVSPGSSKIDPDEKKKRLIVEFAIENAQVVKRRQEAEMKDRTQNEKKTSTREGSDAVNSSGGAKRELKRKRGDRSADARNAKKAKSSTQASNGADKSDDQNHIAKRNRIIAKKRMLRKTRKGK
ncbi:ribosome biogenesis protein [Coccidioides immitis RS]|uniref:Nucleolar protein 4 n=2 Tax=Coccidioides immitis TaxID=5501 RepID=A0A0J8RR58_COCIT|nr:ribosome biogenesis protein [Coccidioides immitis RS]EAS33175.3 ribosome biogenesis protein [Coccidioides immitis RS]KMP08467.1 nucleolar protein 4 [Coccidioides immitis RMSCC 2394]KMU87282.1 nucleolar protein 4 [Coccidioides immitis H538.4]TPX20079.1 RNA recognition motif-containing protein [Coccidioides immitis]